MVSPSRRNKQREMRKKKHPNRVPCTKSQYMSRFPEIVDEIRLKLMKDNNTKKE